MNHNWFAVLTAQVLLDKKLSSTQKLLIALISNLSNERGYCYASNAYLGQCLDVSDVTISQNISILEKGGYIGRIIVRNSNNEVEERFLTVIERPLPLNLMGPPMKQDPPPIEFNGTPPIENHKENNKVFNKYINRETPQAANETTIQTPLQTLPQPEIQVAPPGGQPPVDRSLLGVVVYNAEDTVLSNQIEFERICMVTKTSRQNALESLRLYHLHLQEKERYPMGKRAVFAGFEKWLMDPYGFSKEAKNRKSANQDTPPVKQFNGGGLAKMRAIQKEYEEKVKREAGNG